MLMQADKYKQNRKNFLMLAAVAILCIAAILLASRGNLVSAADSWWDKLWGGKDDEAAKALTFLKGNEPYLKFVTLTSYFGNVIAWGFIKFLFALAEGAQSLVNSVFKLGNLMTNSDVSSFYNSLVTYIAWGVMLVCLIWFGIRYATSGRNSGLSIGTTAQQIVIAVVLLIFGPTMVNTIYDSTAQSFQDVTQKGNDLPTLAITDNMSDIMYLAESSNADYGDLFPGKTSVKKTTAQFGDNAWSSGSNADAVNNIKTTDFTMVLSKKDIENGLDSVSESKKKPLSYLEYKIDTDSDGNAAAVKIPDDDGIIPFVDLYQPGYQRYPSDKLTIILSEISIAIAYCVTAFTIAMTLIELPFKMLAGTMAVATLREQKIKTVVNDICQSFLLIFWTGIELRFYQMAMTAISNSKVKGLAVGILFIAATFLLWKGQDTLTKYFGINTGLRGGLAPLMGAMAAGHMFGSTAKGIGSLASGSVSAFRGAPTVGNAGKKNAAGIDGAGEDAGDDDGGGNGGGNGGNAAGINSGSTLGNIARHPVTNALGAIRHPLNTASRLGKTATGAVEAVSTAAGYLNNTDAVEQAKDLGSAVKQGAANVGTAMKDGAATATKPLAAVKNAVQDGYASGADYAKTNHPMPNADGDVGVGPDTSPDSGAKATAPAAEAAKKDNAAGISSETPPSGPSAPSSTPVGDSTKATAPAAEAAKKGNAAGIPDESTTTSTTQTGDKILQHKLADEIHSDADTGAGKKTGSGDFNGKPKAEQGMPTTQTVNAAGDKLDVKKGPDTMTEQSTTGTMPGKTGVQQPVLNTGVQDRHATAHGGTVTVQAEPDKINQETPKTVASSGTKPAVNVTGGGGTVTAKVAGPDVNLQQTGGHIIGGAPEMKTVVAEQGQTTITGGGSKTVDQRANPASTIAPSLSYSDTNSTPAAKMNDEPKQPKKRHFVKL